MSFGNIKVFSGVQEVLTLALMVVTMLALFYIQDFTLKVGMAALSFSVIFLSSLAAAILRQQKETREKQVKQA